MKPMQITRNRADGTCTLRLNARIARSYGARLSKRLRSLDDGSWYLLRRDPAGKYTFSLGPGHNIASMTLEGAEHIAHHVGRYMLGFGDLVFAYCDTVEP